MAWLLFPLVVLATLSKGTLASVKDASVCDTCDNKEEGQIWLRGSVSSSSAQPGTTVHQQLLADGLQCDNPLQESYTFTTTDSTVACYQLGFTKGSTTGMPGSGCRPDQETFLVVHPPRQGWEEQLFNCSLPAVPAGIYTLETAISVACINAL